MSKFTSLDDLYVHGLQEAYDAETQLLGVLPLLVDAATDLDLKRILEGHRHETHGHVRRVEELFGMVSQPALGHRCDGMFGLLRQGYQVLDADADPGLIDTALIAAVQRMEHYEIATYGSLRTYTLMLGYDRAREILDQILGEEETIDMKLTELAESVIFPHAPLGEHA